MRKLYFYIYYIFFALFFNKLIHRNYFHSDFPGSVSVSQTTGATFALLPYLPWSADRHTHVSISFHHPCVCVCTYTPKLWFMFQCNQPSHLHLRPDFRFHQRRRTYLGVHLCNSVAREMHYLLYAQCCRETLVFLEKKTTLVFSPFGCYFPLCWLAQLNTSPLEIRPNRMPKDPWTCSSKSFFRARPTDLKEHCMAQ